jgi:protein-S-isoprenylcysteine O-methyltransferase Ste14
MSDYGSTLRRGILSGVCFFLILGLAMFLPAGIGWTRGWLFLAVFLLQMLLMALYVWRKNPDVFIARSRIQQGTKGWDRVLFYVLQVLILALFPVGGLDHRYHWSAFPLWIIVFGYVLLTMAMAGNAWVLSVNKFAEMGVRIQPGQQVIDRGPYSVVRHPMYATIFPLFGGIPLALGSFWALIPGTLVSLVLVVRTLFEDRMLQQELAGYKEYAARVRYRLIPGVW